MIERSYRGPGHLEYIYIHIYYIHTYIYTYIYTYIRYSMSAESRGTFVKNPSKQYQMSET
jgi:hypothetical protein